MLQTGFENSGLQPEMKAGLPAFFRSLPSPRLPVNIHKWVWLLCYSVVSPPRARGNTVAFWDGYWF